MTKEYCALCDSLPFNREKTILVINRNIGNVVSAEESGATKVEEGEDVETGGTRGAERNCDIMLNVAIESCSSNC